MFFDIALLCPQSNGKFAIIWIAATRGITKLSKKQILNVDVVHICAEISSMCITESQKPKERLSLSLSSRLVNGAIKILFQQTRLLQDQLFQCLTLPTSIFIKPLPVGSPKKRVQKKIRTSVVPPIEIELQQVAHMEFNITDQDVEEGLRQLPTTHIDTITLREEMPLRTRAEDEDNFFGDEGLTLKERVEFERSWHKDMPQIRPQTGIERSQELQLEKKLFPELFQIEETAPEREHAVELLQEKEPVMARRKPERRQEVEQIEEQPQTPQRKSTKKIMQIEEELQETPQMKRAPRAAVESPAKRRRSLEPEFTPHVRALHPKLLLKVNTGLKKIQVRCEDNDYEMWTEARYHIDRQAYKTVLKDLHDFFGGLTGRIPPVEITEELQPRDSRGTDSLQTVRRVTEDTPIAGAHSQKRISPQEMQKRVDDEVQITRQRKQLSGKRSASPEVEIPAIPPVVARDSPLITTHDATTRGTISVIEGVTEKPSEILETIIEDLPPAATTAYERIVVETIPEAVVKKEKALKFSERQQKIINIVKNWNFNLRYLTIEDLVEKPLNRLKMAAAFYDLLYLHKLQYVKIIRKHDSNEIDHIEKGAKM